jgi:hypothetical protein
VSNSELNVIIVERYLSMTKKEAAIVSAYTGFLIGKFEDLHGYAEEVLERPVFTHEFGIHKIANELREKSKKDFVSIVIEDK